MSSPTIHSYLVCKHCLAEHRGLDHRNLSVGITPTGIEVWCNIHYLSVAVLTPQDIQGMIDAGPQCDACAAGTPHDH